VGLIDSLASTRELADVFGDESVLAAMLQFEVALASAEAASGIIPRAAASVIASAAVASDFDSAALQVDALRAATLSIPFVKAFTERVRATDAAAAGFVHWGATSQDLADTALVLLLKRAEPILVRDLNRLVQTLRQLSDNHKDSVMLGRTLLQAATPTTFGLKVAGWLAAIERCATRLNTAFGETLILQFGGAAGTLAALQGHGLAVAEALARELEVSLPDAPWHAHRDRMAALLSACGVLTASLGKMARDLSLMMQSEIGEAAEPSGAGRGGSSAMPHKRNPVGCALTLAAAVRVPGQVAAYLSAMVQEHERGMGGWQSEWPVVAAVIQGTGLAVSCMAEVAGKLTVDPARMRANIEATSGAIFAEKAMMLLAPKLGRDTAHVLMDEATRRSVREKRRLAEVLAQIPDVVKHIDAADLSRLESPEDYLGSAEAFRLRLLSTKASSKSGQKKD